MVWLALLLPLGLKPAMAPAAIDVVEKAVSMDQLLERLSKQTGAKLKAAPTIGHEIVFVDAKGVDPTELKQRLANAVTATWIREGDTETLTRTPALEKQVWKSHIAYRRQLVDEALKVVRKQVETKFDGKSLATGLVALGATDDTSDRADIQRRAQAEKVLYAQGPAARLLDRLLLACNPDDLAAVGPYERRIFTFDPSVMQCGIDRDKYAAALAAYAVEQQNWIDEAAKVDFKDDNGIRMASDPRTQLQFGTQLKGVSLEVKRSEMTALLMVNLTSDEMPDFGYQVLTQNVLADPGRAFLDSQLNPTGPDKNDPLVTLSDSSIEFQKRATESFRGGQPGALSPKMRDMILHTDQSDPLSWTVSDGLTAYADSRKLNVVAAIPDMALSLTTFMASTQPLRVGAFIKGLVDSGTITVREKGGWSEIASPDAYEAELDFTPRNSALTLMKAVFAKGGLDIHDYARYAFESKRLNRGGLGDWFLAMTDRSFLGASDHTDWKGLQLYGSFSTVDQASLENGSRFPYAALGPEQRRIVDRIVYGGRMAKVIKADPARGIRNSAQEFEPTTAFARGLPGSCVIDATAKGTPVVVAYGKGADGKTRPLRNVAIWTLATIETQIVGNPEMMARYGVPDLAGYAMGIDKVVTLRVEVMPGAEARSTITVPDYDSNATPVPWKELPAPFPKQIADAIAQAKANKSAQPGKGVPPP